MDDLLPQDPPCTFPGGGCNRKLVANVPKTEASGPGHSPQNEAAARDRELVRLVQKGQTEAFEELVRRHQRRVLAVAGSILRQKEDAEDVAQQVFLKAFASIDSFDLRAAFSTWLYKISINECWDHLRKKKVRPLLFESEMTEEQAERLEQFAGGERSAAGSLERAELRQLAGLLLANLGEEDRQILLLKEVEGFSVQEIAEVFDLNVNTVKVRLFRSRNRLMDAYRRQVGRRSPSSGQQARGVAK